jgi:hypothetical protein
MRRARRYVYRSLLQDVIAALTQERVSRAAEFKLRKEAHDAQLAKLAEDARAGD